MIQSLSVCCVIVQLDLICATKGTMDWVQRLKSVNFALIVWFCTALYNHMLVHMLLHSLPTELGAAADAVPGGTASRASWTRPGSPSNSSKEGQSGTQAFVRSYKNLNFYWILGAGHMVINFASSI
jgi:serine carboxypeptidase 1